MEFLNNIVIALTFRRVLSKNCPRALSYSMFDLSS